MPEIIACKVCGRVHAIDEEPTNTVAHCTRCGSAISRRTMLSLHWTLACTLAALILYLPANEFPILRLEMYGATTENTVWQGCVRLFQDGQWGIAAIVFLASIAVPLLKLLGLFILAGSTLFRVRRWKLGRTVIFRIIENIGRWAMLDVFVMAILVSLVKLQRLATIIPGKGLVAFTAVVVLTLIASATFDPQLIWEKEEVVE
jgi:paraquat-inducible protein A